MTSERWVPDQVADRCRTEPPPAIGACWRRSVPCRFRSSADYFCTGTWCCLSRCSRSGCVESALDRRSGSFWNANFDTKVRSSHPSSHRTRSSRYPPAPGRNRIRIRCCCPCASLVWRRTANGRWNTDILERASTGRSSDRRCSFAARSGPCKAADYTCTWPKCFLHESVRWWHPHQLEQAATHNDYLFDLIKFKIFKLNN